MMKGIRSALSPALQATGQGRVSFLPSRRLLTRSILGYAAAIAGFSVAPEMETYKRIQLSRADPLNLHHD